MSDTRYKVVFDGTLVAGADLDSTKEKLAALFKSDLSKIESLFRGVITLKRDLSEEEAKRYASALHSAGAQARVEADLASSLSLVEEESQPAEVPEMSCPKCGHNQPQSTTCSACGIVIEKFLARQAAEAAAPAVAVEASAQSVSPYSAPQAELTQYADEVGELNVFTIQGRIGRLRYLAWSLVLMLAVIPLYLIAAGLMTVSTNIGVLLLILVGIGVAVVSVFIGGQRLHDIGWSAWLLLLNLVPFVGWIFTILMLAMPGTPGANRYGPPPPANSTAVVVLAWLWLGLMILSIIAAIAVPLMFAGLQH